MRREVGLMRLLGRAALPDPDTLGNWRRRMGDPQTEQAGFVGLACHWLIEEKMAYEVLG